MKKHLLATIHQIFALILLTAGIAILYGCSSNNKYGTPQAGERYELIAPIYIVGAYDSLNNKVVSRETAKANLNPIRYADRNYHAFHEQIPAGTVMTILSVEPDTLHFPYWVTKRIVGLTPDPSRGLDVILTLDRGMEGNLDGLNPELFRKLPPASVQ